ncbi:LacI family DNA-binding transcriptional regulator [Thalassiella azotivora]
MRPVEGGSASIADVARTAGVSIATVSRALRGLPEVAETTRQRVIAAAVELDYAVSPLAAGLASGKVRSIAVVTPHVGRWFFGEVLHAVSAVVGQRGYDIVMYVVDSVQARRSFFSDLPPRGRVGGVITMAMPMSEHETDRLRSLRVPVIAVGHDADLPRVRVDDRLAARTAVQHLVDLGHERIAVVNGDAGESWDFVVPRHRLEAYEQVLRENGLCVDPRWRPNGHFTADGGQVAMQQILDAGPPYPTAVFSQSDEMAFGVLRALRRAGLRVPHDVSVVGVDDHELARLWDLTTVAQPVAEHGRVAAQRLLDAIDAGGPAPDEAEETLLPVRLVVRSTTAPPARLRGPSEHADEPAARDAGGAPKG